MTSTQETKTLRERVAEMRAKWDREQAESEAQEARRMRERLKAAMLRKLSVEVDESAITMRDADTPIVEVEGFRFSLFEGSLAEVRRCEACGKEFFRIINSLGSIADSFMPYPHNNSYCVELAKQPEQAATTEQRLLQALRDFIAEHSYQG